MNHVFTLSVFLEMAVRSWPKAASLNQFFWADTVAEACCFAFAF